MTPFLTEQERARQLPDTRDHGLEPDIGSCSVGTNWEWWRHPAFRS
jgi:hypothetical protein